MFISLSLSVGTTNVVIYYSPNVEFHCFLQDNVIFERLTEASQYKESTVAHLEQFATEGK